MSTIDVPFCRNMLKLIRADAKKAKVSVPTHLTCLRCGGHHSHWFLVEGSGGFRKDVQAHNAYEARYGAIASIIFKQAGAK